MLCNPHIEWCNDPRSITWVEFDGSTKVSGLIGNQRLESTSYSSKKYNKYVEFCVEKYKMQVQ